MTRDRENVESLCKMLEPSRRTLAERIAAAELLTQAVDLQQAIHRLVTLGKCPTETDKPTLNLFDFPG